MTRHPDTETNGRSARADGLGSSLVALGTILLIGFVVIGAVTAPASAATEVGTAEATTTHILDLNADGSARVTLQLSYDLETSAELAAFESLRGDTAAKTTMAETFSERLSTVAAAVSERTGRSTTVSDAAVSVSTSKDGAVGTISITATWTDLAATSTDRITLTEPYASGFVADHRFVVRPPAGFTIVDASPEPTQSLEDGVSWAAGTDLAGFRLVAASDGKPAAGSTSPGTTSSGQPGFGWGIGVLGALGAGSLFWHRHRS